MVFLPFSSTRDLKYLLSVTETLLSIVVVSALQWVGEARFSVQVFVCLCAKNVCVCVCVGVFRGYMLKNILVSQERIWVYLCL